MSFMIFKYEKTLFEAGKTRSLKSRKIHIFPNGLTHDLGPKMPIFQSLFFTQFRPAKCLLCRKKRLPSQKNQEVQKVEKLTFSQRG